MISWGYIVQLPESGTPADGFTPLSAVVPKDLAIDDTGDLALPPRLVEGIDAVVQRLRIRFRFWLREWFLDQRQGVPYLEQILVAAPDLLLIESIFRNRVILPTPGVASLRSFRMSRDRRARTLSIDDFEAALVDGSVLKITETPFVVYSPNG